MASAIPFFCGLLDKASEIKLDNHINRILAKDWMQMETAAIHSAKHILFIIGIILCTGSFSGILAQKFKVPDVVVFLLIGIGLGPEMLDVINVRADSSINSFSNLPPLVVDAYWLAGKLGLFVEKL